MLVLARGGSDVLAAPEVWAASAVVLACGISVGVGVGAGVGAEVGGSVVT